MKKKAVIYARFSSHAQTEQSIEGQLRECYEYAKRNDLTIIAEYIDRALTGTTDKRPQFLKMIDDSKKKHFEYVLVYQLDRFARNRYDSANYKAKLKKNGVRVLSAKENISDDASGILIEGVLESMAEYYSAELSQKTKRGVKESLIKGNFIGGYTLLGYDIVNKKWQVNPAEAEIVRDIFERYKNGEKGKEIIDRLNKQGVKPKNSNNFTMNAFARIIRNEKYIGKITIDGILYPDVVPPIVDERLFKECNIKMDEHKHRQRETKSEKPYILSGKMFCGYCGSAMTAETGTSHNGQVYHYYKCYGKKTDNKSCKKKNVKQDEIEDIVFNATVDYVLTPTVIDKISKIVVEKFNAEIEKPTALIAYENELKTVKKSINKIMAAIEDGVYTKTTKDRLLSLEASQENLEAKIAVEKAKQIKPLELYDVKTFLNYFARKKYNSDQEKNEFFNSFINRVILFDDRVVILYNTNKKETKRLTKKEISDITNGKNVDNVKENSLETKRFKRVLCGCGEGI